MKKTTTLIRKDEILISEREFTEALSNPVRKAELLCELDPDLRDRLRLNEDDEGAQKRMTPFPKVWKKLFHNQPMPNDPAVAKAAVVLEYMRKERFIWRDDNTRANHKRTVSISARHHIISLEYRTEKGVYMSAGCMLNMESDNAVAFLSTREISREVAWRVLEGLRLSLLYSPEMFFTPDANSEKIQLEVTENEIIMDRKLADDMFSLLKLNALEHKG